MTTKGVLLFAKNNGQYNYVKMASVAAAAIKHHLKCAVALVTDEPVSDPIFDHVLTNTFSTKNTRRTSHGKAPYYNWERCDAYHISPFDETLLIDVDYIVRTDVLSNVWGSKSDYVLMSRSQRVSHDEHLEERMLSDGSIEMVWATVMYFKKTEASELLFDMFSHVRQHWDYYRTLYRISNPIFRNDYALSIAVHALNNFEDMQYPKFPFAMTNLYYPERVLDVNLSRIVVESENIPYKLIGDVHCMNKESLEEHLDCIGEQYA